MKKFVEKMSNISEKEYEEIISEYPHNVEGHWVRKFPYEFWKYVKYLSHAEFSLIIEKTRNENKVSMITIEKILNEIAIQFDNKELQKQLED